MTAAAPVRPSFAHASEAELARILDFYQVRWHYEPDTYPIGWNLDGDVVESFAPDFYLPDMELYVELTTLKQKLVRKKNRKLRRLRELYPDIRIKLFYGRDFRMLMLKFGRMALLDDMFKLFSDHGVYGGMVTKKNRCVRIEYKDEFWLDILPACRDDHNGGTCIQVPDRDRRRWNPSNPVAYADWFKNVSRRIAGRFQKL